MTPPTPADDALEAASEDDRIWFQERPHRRFRIRPHAPGEWPQGALGPPPTGWRWFTVIRQIAPGVRVRRPFTMEGEPASGEHAASRIFEIVMRGGA